MFGPSLFSNQTGRKDPSQVCCLTSSGTWTCPIGARKIVVVTIGAGGGGGGGRAGSVDCTLNTGGGGGGGGAVSICEVISSSIPSSACIIVGQGGCRGNTSPSPTNGGNGGSSIFCTESINICSTGGAGGAVGTINLFAPGGPYTSAGGNGGSGNCLNGGQGGNGFACRTVSPSCTDVNGRQGTFPTTNGGRPGGGGGGYFCIGTVNGSGGANTSCTTFTICGQNYTLGQSGQGADFNVCFACAGNNFAAGGGGGASPGDFLPSAGGTGAPGLVSIISFF